MIVGVDYASVDGNTPPDWDALQASCRAHGRTLGFAIFRGAWGVSPDHTVQRDWQRAKAAGLTCGAYLFVRMSRQLSPVDQVHVYADSVGALTADDFVPVLDIEDAGMSAADELDYTYRAWQEIQRIYGVPPIIYTSARVWAEQLGNSPSTAMVDSPLWVAKPWPWRVHAPAQLASAELSALLLPKWAPVVPTPWGPGNWWMHQYQGDAYPTPGFLNTVDLSRFGLMCQGETGARVRWVQRRLRTPVTGTFGPETDMAVRSYQGCHGLTMDGVIGPKTFARLAWSPAE